ncbi:MAG: exopolysaccharide biosynthesis polyprenyl glycosylphosphotransferase [Alphaproteobacteria bacterium]|nr:exopolysaccharide biosynthesis polyprenyl glycosylphosphotransferase [Alphaproteobacteria bacterium]
MSSHQQSQFVSFRLPASDFQAGAVDFASPGPRQAGANDNALWANGWPKRALDVAIAGVVLFIVSPFLLVVALLIRLDSKGPILFRQTRRGRSGRPFDILKFRTMTVLEDGDHIVQARPGDARHTRVGRWLRAYSIDELPQLINVLRGEMSLVGPRPHARAHDAYYGKRIAQYEERQVVKPGLTGWAQVNGLRGPTPTDEVMARRVDLDVWYAAHASLRLDLKILLRTPLEVLRGRNAC